MRLVWMCLLVFCAPVSALAEQLLVSVGNSGAATRVVLTFETLPNWTSTRSDRTVVLTFDDAKFKVSSEDQDAAVSNARIAGITSDESGRQIALEVSCDCATDVYPFGAGSLVLEVRDRLAPEPLDAGDTTAPQQPPYLDGDLSVRIAKASEDTAPETQPPKPLAEVSSEAEPNSTQPFEWQPSNAGLDFLNTLGFSLPSDQESQAIALLSRELSRAASQGLVAPGTGGTQSQRGAAPQNPSELEDRSNIKIVTSLDRAISPNHGRHPPTAAGSRCFPDSDVDVANWGDTSDISQIGKLRHAAYGENGDITPDGALELARYYVALGFGAEAAAAARFMNEGPQKELVIAMAEIVDHGASSSPVLDGQIFCGGQIALWAALAKPMEKGAGPGSINVILSTFSALAPHHRAHLGPVLAERLRAVGLENEARNAVNAVARGGLQSNESELVTARLELGGTRPDKARDTLVEISNGTDVTAAEALLELLEDAERRNMAPNPDWVEDAPSLARATEGTEIAETLNLAGLRGRIALGQFDELRYALADDTPGLDATSRDHLARLALVEASRTAEDAEFLRSELGLLKVIDIGEMTHANRFEVAHRLLSIGLAERAQVYLSEEPASNDELETLVQIYTETGQSDRAVAILSEREGPAAALQLGHVLSRTGANASAIVAYEQGGSIENAAQSAIRAGDWNWIAGRQIEGSTGALSEAAQLLSSASTEGLISTDPDSEPVNGLLISGSQALRQHAETLLTETDLPSSAQPFTN